MIFTTASGALSHLRNGEVVVKVSTIVGLSGAVGALIGAAVSNVMPLHVLSIMTGLMLLSGSGICYLKLYHAEWLDAHLPARSTVLSGAALYRCVIPVGILSGFLSGAFGIGAAAYIQLALMIIFGLPLIQSIGTCMMIILPISAAGGLGYLLNGHLLFSIFIQTLLGLMIGAWFGAKITHLAPLSVLKAFIVTMPLVGGLIMMVFSC